MAHDIELRNGKYQMFAVGQTGMRDDVWHKLGTRVGSPVQWREAATLAGMDTTVSKKQLELNGELVPAWAIVRDQDGAFFGTCGEGYEIVQNAEVFEFGDDLVGVENGAHYDAAGCLGNGAQVWTCIRIPRGDFEVVDGDRHDMYLTLTSSHDLSLALTAALSGIRSICRNTVRQALRTATGIVRVKHTANARQRIESAREAMDGVMLDAQRLKDKLTMLSQRKMTKDSMQAIFDRLFPAPKDKEANQTRRENVLREILALYESNDRNAIPQIRGTAYNLLNAVTEYTDHFRSVRLTDGRKGYTADTARAENAVVGTGEKLKSQALEYILEATANNPAHQVIVSRPIASAPAATGSVLDQILAASGY